MAGERWEIRGVPVGWGIAAMNSALRSIGWEANPERALFSGRSRVWYVRAANDPPVHIIEFSDDEPPVTINRARLLRKRAPVARQQQQQVFHWRRPTTQSQPQQRGRPGGVDTSSTQWVRGSNLRTGAGWADEDPNGAPQQWGDQPIPLTNGEGGSSSGSGSGMDEDRVSEGEFLAELIPAAAHPAEIAPVARRPRRRKLQGPSPMDGVVAGLAEQLGQLTSVIRDMQTEMGNMQARIVDLARPLTPATQVVPNSPARAPVPQLSYSAVAQGAAPARAARRLDITGAGRPRAHSEERGRRERSSSSEGDRRRDRSRDGRMKPGIV